MRGNNVSYIPNELASAIKGGYVTSTEQLKDYVQNKSQESINQEVSSFIENIQNYYYQKEEINNIIEILRNQINQIISSRFVIISESEYEQLTEYVQGVIYLILEDGESVNHTGWKLGDGLPIILSGEWKFGDNLPIILS